MDIEEAVEIIKRNWPDDRYTMLREALNVVLEHLPTSDNSDYAKLPTIGAIVDELNGGKNLEWTDTDVVPIIKAIKKLGNVV